MTPEDIYNRYIGMSLDFDNFPKSNPFQCWDFMKAVFIALDIPVNTYCALTGYVADLWKLKDQYYYWQYFTYIYGADSLQNGDIVFWDIGSSHPLSHVAMYYNGQELGQNQSRRYVTLEHTTWDILGALRPKAWTKKEKGYAESFDPDIAGKYRTTANLHLRTGGSTDYDSICVMPKGTTVQCYGYYHTEKSGRIWLYVTYANYVGFACMEYLTL